MTHPSAFEIGGAVGSNIAHGIHQGHEQSLIGRMLAKAQETGNPQEVHNVIGQIVSQVSPENQPYAFQALNAITGQQQAARQRTAMQAEGYNPDLPMELHKLRAAKEVATIKAAQQAEKQQKISQKTQDHVNAIKKALFILGEQEKLEQSGHVGSKFAIRGTGADWGKGMSGKGLEAQSNFERNGKSLIGMSTNIAIRNIPEFKTMAEGLTNPRETREHIRGNITALKDALNYELSLYESGANNSVQEPAIQTQPNQKQSIEEIFGIQ